MQLLKTTTPTSQLSYVASQDRAYGPLLKVQPVRRDGEEHKTA